LQEEEEIMEFRFEYRFSKAIAMLHKFVIWCEGKIEKGEAPGKQASDS
jgi:hypothetical protein